MANPKTLQGLIGSQNPRAQKCTAKNPNARKTKPVNELRLSEWFGRLAFAKT